MRKLVGTVVLAAIAIYFAFQFFGAQIASAVLEKSLGVPVEIHRIHVKLYPTEFGIYGLKIHNPEGFKEPMLASIQELFIGVDVLELLKGKAHVKRVVLNIDQVTAERAGGKINLMELLNAGKKKAAEQEQKQQPAPPKEPGTKKPAPKAQAIKTQIDEAVVSLGKVLFIDSTAAGEPSIKKIDLKVQEFTLRNVDGALSLVEKIVFEVLRRIGLSALGPQFNMIASSVGEEFQDVVDGLSNLFSGKK